MCTKLADKTDRRAVLHYVHLGLPRQSGYTLRTQAIAVALRGIGYGISVALRPTTMVDVGGCDGPYLDQGGVGYFAHPLRGTPGALSDLLKELERRGIRGTTRIRRILLGGHLMREMARYARWLTKTVGEMQLVHAHSPPLAVREAVHLASFWRVPLVYEVRGFWGLSKSVERGMPGGIDELTLQDTHAARNRRVRHVVAICQAIADQLVKQGVDARKISIVPNGVDTSAFRKRNRNQQLLRDLGLQGRFVFGYITSVRRMEGIQCVIEAWRTVLREIPEAVFVLIGGGAYLDTLKRIVDERGLNDSFRFVGLVPFDRVLDYYSLLDVFVVPRISAPVCHMVTPLKPLEAMAMEIPVIASDVRALREMVIEGQTGVLFQADDPKSLASACVRMARDHGGRRQLSQTARAWVERERDWRAIALRYDSIYSSLLR